MLLMDILWADPAERLQQILVVRFLKDNTQIYK